MQPGRLVPRGSVYLCNAFTEVAEREVDFLVGMLGPEPGPRVLDDIDCPELLLVGRRSA